MRALPSVSLAIRGDIRTPFSQCLREIPFGVTDLELWFGPIPTLPRRLSNLCRLTRLEIFSLRELRTIAAPLPSALEMLGLFDLVKLTSITTDLNQVKVLSLVRCGQLQELSGKLDSLEQFEIDDCPLLQFPELPATLSNLSHNGNNRQTLPYRLPVNLRRLDLRDWPNLKTVPPLPEGLKMLDLRGSERVRRIFFAGKLVQLDRRPDGPYDITVDGRLKVFLQLRPKDQPQD